ncbi:unnamed protein product [Rotaria sp. Silwood1]|nr:unnamed protein product [Rotaria sp. Silwood1]
MYKKKTSQKELREVKNKIIQYNCVMILSDEKYFTSSENNVVANQYSYSIDSNILIVDIESKKKKISEPKNHGPICCIYIYLGGNVYCGPLLKEHIDKIIANKESNRYFLMSRIYPPINTSLIRSSRANDNNEFILEKQINGELGIFGSLISQNGTVIYERVGGSLLRSKPVTNIEGGIASGQGYIDSVFLV